VQVESDKRVAVLIDAENISAKNIEEILNKASVEGRATVKRIYGDFSSESKSSQARAWNKEVSEHALSQVQQIQNSTGKNSSDSALIIDAMDLL
jgi:biotin carboxylase